jgi:tetratricopeptide (TPR) repeat protein
MNNQPLKKYSIDEVLQVLKEGSDEQVFTFLKSSMFDAHRRIDDKVKITEVKEAFEILKNTKNPKRRAKIHTILRTLIFNCKSDVSKEYEDLLFDEILNDSGLVRTAIIKSLRDYYIGFVCYIARDNKDLLNERKSNVLKKLHNLITNNTPLVWLEEYNSPGLGLDLDKLKPSIIKSLLLAWRNVGPDSIFYIPDSGPKGMRNLPGFNDVQDIPFFVEWFPHDYHLDDDDDDDDDDYEVKSKSDEDGEISENDVVPSPYQKYNFVHKPCANDDYYDAMELLDQFGKSGAGRAKKILLKSILDFGESIQTYVGLTAAAEYSGKHKEYCEYVLKAYNLVKKEHPVWPSEMPWGYMDNRAPLRAISSRANLAQDEGDNALAEELYKSLLRMNPNDNQGVRYVLAGLYEGISGADIDRMFDEGNSKQDWKKLEELVIRQNKIHKFWKP